MVLSVKHAFQSVTPDDPSHEVSSSEWNDAHAMTGVLDVANGGTGTASGISTETQTALDGKVNDTGDTITGVLAISDTTASTSPTTGALTVAGGVGVSGVLMVGKSGIFGDPLTTYYTSDPTQGTLFLGNSNAIGLSYNAVKMSLIGAPVAIPSGLVSSSPTTGALTVAGGVGVGGALRVGADIYTAADLYTGVGGTLGTVRFGASTNNYLHWSGTGFVLNGGPLNILSAAAATSTLTGALTTPGGVGIGDALHVGGVLNVGGQVYLGNRLNQSASGIAVAVKDDITLRVDSGFYENSAATPAKGWPGTGWHHLLATTHSNVNNYYSTQIAASFAPANNLLYWRATDNVGTTAWRTIWDSVNLPATSIAKTTISDTPPATPVAGNLWWESDTGVLYIYFDDGTSSQWVVASPQYGITQATADARYLQLTGGTLTGRLTAYSPTFSPASPTTAALMTTGAAYGGGIVLADGAGYSGIYTQNNGAEMVFGTGGTSSALAAQFRINSTGLIPNASATYNLGSAALRWSTVYTSDLSLSNGIGDWTIVEGEDDLFLYNNKRGKTYKFALTEVDPSVVPAKKV